ncbi:MAG: family 20 glycosylhydrolase, partial [Alistipes sp.]|nr:family 20 glycosylhydrolase [Alistipes sp.]
MRRFATLLLFALLGCATLSAQYNHITPAPVRVQGGVCDGDQCGVPEPFDATRTFKLYIKGADSADAARLEAAVSAAGLEYERVNRIAKRDFKGAFIFINIFPESMEYDEGYAIWTDPNGVSITAKTPAGAYYALQSIRQMVEAGEWQTGLVVDYPRFEYRGALIDISRHFRSVDFLKRQIDMMARLKMNRLHLHLTDAAGWRLEIESYPRLTSYAAWRTPHDWKGWWYGDRQFVDEGTEGASGGYLTKEEARELVAYAADRYIT